MLSIHYFKHHSVNSEVYCLKHCFTRLNARYAAHGLTSSFSRAETSLLLQLIEWTSRARLSLFPALTRICVEGFIPAENQMRKKCHPQAFIRGEPHGEKNRRGGGYGDLFPDVKFPVVISNLMR